MTTTKLGLAIDPNGGPQWGDLSSQLDHIEQVAEASLKRLQMMPSILFRQHRVEPEVALEDVMLLE